MQSESTVSDVVFSEEYSLVPQVHEPSGEAIKAHIGESRSAAYSEKPAGLLLNV